MSELLMAVRKKRHARKKELQHLRVFAGDGATHENPSWIVEHDFGEDHEPEQHRFTDHGEMIEHLSRHTSTEPLDEA